MIQDNDREYPEDQTWNHLMENKWQIRYSIISALSFEIENYNISGFLFEQKGHQDSSNPTEILEIKVQWIQGYMLSEIDSKLDNILREICRNEYEWDKTSLSTVLSGDRLYVELQYLS